jgi:amidase
MKRLTRDKVVHALDKATPAAFSVEDGETFVVETHDCWGGNVTREGTKVRERVSPNPATGPIEVVGAQPGEALVVTVHEVTPADWGFIAGGGVDDFTIIEMRGGLATYPGGRQFPLHPMIGVMGVAPAGEAVPTTTPGDHGGNLDTVDLRAGSVISLPVAVPGAMLALGDVHALQGDGECGGTGVECAAEVTLTVKRVKEPLWPMPLIVRDDTLMLLASGDTLDEAAWLAVGEMAKLITKLTGLPDHLARRLLSTVGEVRISQIVNPRKGCRAVIPKAAIGERWPF